MTELLTMIKPWAFKHRKDISDSLKYCGQLIQIEEIQVPEKLLRFLYGRFEGQLFYELMVSDLVNREGTVAIYEGDIARFAELKKEIRKIFDPLLPLNTNNVGYTRNCIHTSDSLDAAAREVNFTRNLLTRISRLQPTATTLRLQPTDVIWHK